MADYEMKSDFESHDNENEYGDERGSRMVTDHNGDAQRESAGFWDSYGPGREDERARDRDEQDNGHDRGHDRDRDDRRDRDRDRLERRNRDEDRESRRYAPYTKGRRGGRRLIAERQCRVYVTNLPYDMRWQDLKDIMKKVADVQHVEMMLEKDGRPMGTAVVEFPTPDDAQRAIKDIDGFEVKGRKMRLREDRVEDEVYEKQLTKTREMEEKIKAHSTQSAPVPSGLGVLGNLLGSSGLNALTSKSADPINCTVFVKNLDYRVTWQKLKDFFRKAGNVIRADIDEDAEHKSKGYGTVVFETPLEALNAVSILNGQVFYDRTIQCRMDRNSSLAQLSGASTGGGGARSGGSSTSPNINPLAVLQLQSLAALTQLTGGGNSLGLTGGVGGLSGGGASSLSNSLGGASSNAGGLGLGALGGLSALLGGGGGLSSLGGFGPGASSTPTGSSGYGYSSGSGNSKQVFVRNLPWRTTWQELKDKFREVGRVARADVLMDDKGRSKGCGTVVFERAEDAERAVSMINGTVFDGREIDVRLDRG